MQKIKKTFTCTEKHCYVLNEWMTGRPKKISTSFVVVARQIMDKSLLHWTGGNVFKDYSISKEFRDMMRVFLKSCIMELTLKILEFFHLKNE